MMRINQWTLIIKFIENNDEDKKNSRIDPRFIGFFC
jgi:hypothetical protein